MSGIEDAFAKGYATAMKAKPRPATVTLRKGTPLRDLMGDEIGRLTADIHVDADNNVFPSVQEALRGKHKGASGADYISSLYDAIEAKRSGPPIIRPGAVVGDARLISQAEATR